MSDEKNQNPQQPGRPDKPEKREQPEVRYVPVEYMPHMHEEDDEIDLKELIRTIWNGRKYIYYSIGIFVVLGLITALGSSEVYTSEVKLLPERQGSSVGALGGLARQFGVSTPQQQRDGIPADLYPDITRSVVLMQRLMHYEVAIPDNGERVTLFEYFTEHQSPSAASVFKKYTIRLPFTLLGGIRSLFANPPDEMVGEVDRELAGDEKMGRILRMSREEWEIVRNLRERISVERGRDAGVVTVRVDMPDPEIAADVADQVVQFLTEYITEYRTEKARRDVEFIESRYEEALERFEAAQERMARFRDENRGQLTAQARIQEQRLQSEYDLTFNLYNSMAERLEEARIKLQEDTPVVNILEPAAVPDQRSAPKRTRMMMVYVLLGCIVGVGSIFGKQLLENFKFDSDLG